MTLKNKAPAKPINILKFFKMDFKACKIVSRSKGYKISNFDMYEICISDHVIYKKSYISQNNIHDTSLHPILLPSKIKFTYIYRVTHHNWSLF